MRVVELSLRNYRVFEELDLELPARVIGIFGPNGSGKTTLLESMQFALYGKARTDKAQIRTSGVLTDCGVRLVFEHGGQQYEIRRTIRGKNHQVDAELFVGDVQLAAGVSEVGAEIQRLLHMDLPVFRASVFAEQKQLDAFSEVTSARRKDMVLRLLGIRPVDEARAAARKEARDAKQRADDLAAKLPDAAEQEAELERARGHLASARDAAEAAAAALIEARERATSADESFETSDTVRERAERLQVELREVDRAATDAERRRAGLEDRVVRLERDLGELGPVEEELAGVADAPTRLAAARAVSALAVEVTEHEETLGRLEAVDAESVVGELEAADAEQQAARERLTLARSGHERAREALAAAEETLARARDADPSQPCPTCGRPLGEDFGEYVAHCRRSVSEGKQAVASASREEREAGAEARVADRRYRDVVKRAEAARRAIAEREATAERLDRLRRRLDRQAEPFDGAVPDVSALEAAAERAADLERRLAKLLAARDRLEESRADLEACSAEIETSRRRAAEIGAELVALAFDPEEHARLAKERHESRRLLEVATTQERTVSDALKEAESRVRELEAGLQQIQEISSRVRELRDEAHVVDRVSALLEGFRTFLYGRIMPQLSRDAEALFRDLTNHEYEDLRIDEDTLAIEIADADRYYPIDRFSGSEVDLANLALRVAISTHLSRMAGADVGLMVLDEVMAALDAERKDLFVQTIGKLSQRFHQLFVITHAEQVKDQFPASIEVRKVGRRRSTAILV